MNIKVKYGKIRIALFALCAGVLSVACTDDFSKINSAGSPSPDDATGDFFNIGVHLQTLQTNVIICSTINAYQYNENLVGQPYARYLTITKDSWNINNFCVFNASIAWLNSVFNDQMTKVYSSWFELRKILEAEGMMEHYAWGWAELLRVAAMHRTTDMYGPIPYSEVKKNNGALYVSYDTQQEVYEGLFTDLNKAIEILTNYVQSGGATAKSALKVYDVVYDGNFTKWVKFANSLKLRMAMRISYADPVNAKKYALEAINHPIGLITSNSDNAYISNGTNPLYVMYGAYADTRAAAELMTYLKGYDDPRMTKYFEPAEESGEYKALRVGIAISSHDWACKNFSTPRVGEQDPLLWLCAAEVAFLKAEAAAYWGWIGDNAESLYNEGIRLSFAQWNADGAETYINNAVKTQVGYTDDVANSASPVSSITVKWDNAANKEVKLERIMTQKWIAIYPLGLEGWSEQRRTGFPRFFNIPVIHNTDQTLKTRGASRIPYAPSEIQNNPDNYMDALNRKGLGGYDNYGTRLWWDAKNPKVGW
ncbi:MAG: SusD/RagB family nutrient-binding outer membrane lipoprotein [Dysgonamonadaceae bacterium]|jgi:hypothetical protein|nr:SusD/RagB family nutrient-binding outer membrane lipoprotein [Dysgonamonadaceae bacterium]